MKKLLCVVLAVAMMSVMAFSASAAETVDLLDSAAAQEKVYANHAENATMTANDDGSYTVVVSKDATADYSEAYGLAVEPFLTGVDLTATPYMQLKLSCDAPFRITLLDKNAAGETKWISFGSEFFNTVVAEGSEAPSTPPADNFFPAGDYDCFAFLQGYYDWKTNNENLDGYDASEANITAIYIELQKAGTLTVEKMDLAATDGSEGGDETDETAAKTTAADKDSDSKKTGDSTQAVTFAVVAVAAGAVVTLSVVASKKAKAR